MPKHINMRAHLKGLVEGDYKNIRFGHWVIFREMDKTRRATTWDDIRKEARGGPPYQYRDYIILTRRFDQMISERTEHTSEVPLLEIRLDPDSMLYYIQYQHVCYSEILDNGSTRIVHRYIKPKVGDNLFEIDKSAGKCMPSPPFKVIEGFRVEDITEIKGDFGRVEYWIAVCKAIKTVYN